MKVRNRSKKREAILDKIRSATCHPTAEWVHLELKDEIPDLSLGTVYRNIGLFKESGEILSVGTVGGQERFDGNTFPHGHFVCTVCKAVIDVAGFDGHPEAAACLEETGFQITRVELTAYGVCDRCAKGK